MVAASLLNLVQQNREAVPRPGAPAKFNETLVQIWKHGQKVQRELRTARATRARSRKQANPSKNTTPSCQETNPGSRQALRACATSSGGAPARIKIEEGFHPPTLICVEETMNWVSRPQLIDLEHHLAVWHEIHTLVHINTRRQTSAMGRVTLEADALQKVSGPVMTRQSEAQQTDLLAQAKQHMQAVELTIQQCDMIHEIIQVAQELLPDRAKLPPPPSLKLITYPVTSHKASQILESDRTFCTQALTHLQAIKASLTRKPRQKHKKK